VEKEEKREPSLTDKREGKDQRGFDSLSTRKKLTWGFLMRIFATMTVG
jgi:hypothetical protein